MYLLIIILKKSEFMAAQRARPILLNERFLVILRMRRSVTDILYIPIYNIRCICVCLVSMESHTVQLTHMTFILSEPGWAWAGFSHSPIIRYDG